MMLTAPSRSRAGHAPAPGSTSVAPGSAAPLPTRAPTRQRRVSGSPFDGTGRPMHWRSAPRSGRAKGVGEAVSEEIDADEDQDEQHRRPGPGPPALAQREGVPLAVADQIPEGRIQVRGDAEAEELDRGFEHEYLTEQRGCSDDD